MTLNCIWWWGSSSWDLESVEYPIIAIIPMSTQSQSGSTCSGAIYESNKSIEKLFSFNRIVWKKNYETTTKKM